MTSPEQSGETMRPSLEQAQAETRLRMVNRMAGLVADEDLRDVLRRVGKALFEPTTAPEGTKWAVQERALQQAAHDEQVDVIVEYEDIRGLQAATKQIFDLRGKNVDHYRERWESDGAAYPPELDKDARALATKHRLTGNTLPKYDHYNFQLNLGGAANSMAYRQTYGSKIVPALMAVDGRTFTVDNEINLGSTRPVNEAERKRSKKYAQNSKEEFDLAKAAPEVVYGIVFTADDIFEGIDSKIIGYMRRTAQKGELMSETETRERYLELQDEIARTNGESLDAQLELDNLHLPQPPNKWRVAAGKAPDGHNVFAISAGLQAGVWDANDIRKIRPNTSDTYAMLGSMMKDDVEPGGKALVVTSIHFTGFQGADAERLAYDLGLDVDVIGFDPVTFNEAPKPTHELLQEIHSLVSSTIGTAEYVGALPRQS